MLAVQATVDGEITLHGLDSTTISRLRRALSFPNPAYRTAVQFGEDPGPDVPERLCCVTEHADSVSVPRGTIYELKALLAARGLKMEFYDSRSRGQYLPCGELRKPLRDYQQEGVDAVVAGLQGTIVLPCGSGKTTVGIGAIAALSRTTLVLVHTKDLLHQWTQAIKELLGSTAAVFGGGKHDIGPITVATLQSLVKKPEQDLSSFGFCILDEAHSAPCATAQAVLRRCAARWRLGLTATAERSDGLTKLIDWSFGERLLEKGVPELVQNGWLVLPTVHVVKTDFHYDCGTTVEIGRQAVPCRRQKEHAGPCDAEVPTRARVNALRKAVVANEDRNRLVANTVAREIDGQTSLILSNDKAHCSTIRDLLKDRGIKAVVITSDVSTKEREQILDGLRDGSIPVAVATSLADEGLDIPRLSRVFLALPERSRGRTKQRVGRLMRPFGQPAKLFDFVDNRVDTLASRYRSRRAVYRKLGLEILD